MAGSWDVPMSDAPPCCLNCKRMNYDFGDWEMSRPPSIWCEAGLLIPTGKKTCKRQIPKGDSDA